MSSINLSNKEVFDRINYFLKRNKMTAFDLSRELGHDKAYFYRVKTGAIELSMPLFFSILDVLNINTFEFFYPNLERFEDDLMFLDLFNSLPEEEKPKVMKSIYLKIHTD